MHSKVLLLSLMFVFDVYSQELVSPCPGLFTYESSSSENDRWYGNMVLVSSSELNGIWLRIILDKPSIQLGNWFGEIETTDNKDYLLKNRNIKLKPNEQFPWRFFIRYNPAETPPRLVSFRLNARTVCPIGSTTTTPPPPILGVLITSSELSTTVAPRPAEGIPSGDFIFPSDVFNNGGNNQPNQEQCGTVVTQPRPLITYGQATDEAEFPWHAALYHARGIGLTYTCGANLLTKYHLITVAHCVTRRSSPIPINPETLQVFLGKYYLEKWHSIGTQKRLVEKVIPHPSYNSESYFDSDIALIKLKQPVDITSYVRPICLWAGSSDLKTVIGREGTLAGWGFDESGKFSDQLKKAAMPVVSQETCLFSFPVFSQITSQKTFCAGYRNGTTACNGDSGGGLVFSRRSGGQTIWHLRGLVSISVALQNRAKCDTSHYVVFTDVAKYLEWVRSNLN